MEKGKLKIWEMSLLIALCVSLLAGTWAQSRQESISSALVRLHVLAVSDDEYEQELKLRVRDEVIAYLEPRLKNVRDISEARRLLEAELGGIERAAKSAAEGRKVSVTLTEEYYPTREYEDFTLPAGRYRSLRVTLGEGQGHNWWCVVFPPLCLSAAERSRALEVMDSTDCGIVTEAEGYELRFRLVELWGELLNFLEKQ